MSGNTLLPCGLIVISTTGAIAIATCDGANSFIGGASVGIYSTNSITYTI